MRYYHYKHTAMSITMTTLDNDDDYVVKKTNFWDIILFHLNRVRMWRLRQGQVSVYEEKKLVEQHNINPLMQKYMGWRRSLLMISLPSILFSAVFDIIEFVQVVDFSGFSGLGILAYITPPFTTTGFFIAMCFSTIFWNRFKLSANICTYSWLFSLIAPIWPALLPIEMLFEDEALESITQEDLYLIKVTVGVWYSLLIIPLVVTIPSGMVRGSVRIRGLLPESSLAGWFIVLVTPMIPVMTFVAFILVAQIAGDVKLVVGVAFLLVSPLLFIIRRKLYTEAITEEQDRSLDWNQRTMGLLSLIGILLIGVWVVQSGYFPSFASAGKFVCEFIGRSLTSTLVFADAVYRMSVHQLRVDRKRHDDGHYAEVDALLEAIDNKMEPTVSAINGGTEQPADVSFDKDIENTASLDRTEEDNIEFSFVAGEKTEGSPNAAADFYSIGGAAPAHVATPTPTHQSSSSSSKKKKNKKKKSDDRKKEKGSS